MVLTGGELEAEYDRRPGVTDAVLRCESSADLSAWEIVEPPGAPTQLNAAGLETVRIPADSVSPRMAFRLRASLP